MLAFLALALLTFLPWKAIVLTRLTAAIWRALQFLQDVLRGLSVSIRNQGAVTPLEGPQSLPRSDGRCGYHRNFSCPTLPMRFWHVPVWLYRDFGGSGMRRRVWSAVLQSHFRGSQLTENPFFRTGISRSKCLVLRFARLQLRLGSTPHRNVRKYHPREPESPVPTRHLQRRSADPLP
jgi:hypothetical protein